MGVGVQLEGIAMDYDICSRHRGLLRLLLYLEEALIEFVRRSREGWTWAIEAITIVPKASKKELRSTQT